MKLRLALIAPQMGYDKNEYKNKDKKVLPLGIYTLKSYLNQYYSNITLIDAITEEYSEDEIIDIITKNECNIIGISGITNKYYNSILSLAKKLKQIKTILFVFVGGPIATFCYDILLSSVCTFCTVCEFISCDFPAEKAKTMYNSSYTRFLSNLVREMRLELTRLLPHAPQTCLSTYSSTLALHLQCSVIITARC